MTPSDLNLSFAKVCWWGMDPLTLEMPPQDQLDYLGEDLAQIELDHQTVLDIGWYGPRPRGVFRVYLIRSQDWQDPLFQARCVDWGGVIAAVDAAVSFWRAVSDE